MADSAPAIAIMYTLYVCPRISSKLKELMITNRVTASNIISIDISIKIMFFRLRTKPKIPIKNRTSDRFIVVKIVVWLGLVRRFLLAFAARLLGLFIYALYL